MKKIFILMLMILIITGCAKNIQPNVYNESETLQFSDVSKGVILEVIPVKVEGDKIVGTASGAVIGGIAGSAVGGNDTMRVLSGAVGALIGSGIGRTIDGWITNQGGFQYIVELYDDKDVVSIVQGNKNPLDVGDEVLIIDSPEGTRLVKKSLNN